MRKKCFPRTKLFFACNMNRLIKVIFLFLRFISIFYFGCYIGQYQLDPFDFQWRAESQRHFAIVLCSGQVSWVHHAVFVSRSTSSP